MGQRATLIRTPWSSFNKIHCSPDYYSETFHSTQDMHQKSTTFFLPATPVMTLCPLNNTGALWFKASRKFRDHCQDFAHMWRACVESSVQDGTWMCLVYYPRLEINSDDLRLNQRRIPVITQELTRVPFPAESWLDIFSLFVSRAAFSRTSMTRLRSIHSLAWSWWRSTWNLWRRGRRLSKTMPNNWGRPRFFFFFAIVRLKCPKQLVSACVCECVCMLKECLWGLMTTLGQNLTCFWDTGLILQLQCARSLPLSLLIHGAPSPSCVPLCRPHIWCSAELCYRGEEVGADWHMIDRMWSEGG